MKELNYCLTEMGMTTEGATNLMARGRYQEVSVCYIKFEMPIIFSSRDVKQDVEKLDPGFGGRVQAGDKES